MPFYPGWGIALLRAVLGIIYLAHGWEKLFVAPGISGFAESLAMSGFSTPWAAAWLVALIEFLGGLLLLVGWLTRWTAGVVFLEMLIATFAVRVPHGFSVFQPEGQWGYEYNLLLLAGLGALMLAGSGKLALDEWLVRQAAG